MFKWFRKKKITRPFAPLVDAMKEKDAALFDSVASLPVHMAVDKWRMKYPEDFPEAGKLLRMPWGTLVAI